MKRILAATLVLACFTCAMIVREAPATAQIGAPRGETLQAHAEKLRNGLLNESAAGFFSAFAPWVRGNFELMHEKAMDALTEKVKKSKDDGKSDDEIAGDLLKDLHKHDPADVLKLRTLDQITGLTAAQLFSLMHEKYTLHAKEDFKTARESRWHTVDRSVFEAEERMQFRNAARVTKTYGTVTFRNKHDDVIEVTCIAEGDMWEVIDFTADICKVELRLIDMEKTMRDASTRDARRSEGEQLLGTIKNRARVAYAKMGAAPKTVVGDINKGGCGAEAGDLEGRYFKIRDKVLQGGGTRIGLISEPASENSRDGYAMLTIDLADATQAEIVWYDDKKDLEYAISKYEK